MKKILFVVLLINWIFIQASQKSKTTLINVSGAKIAAESATTQPTTPKADAAPSAIGQDTARAIAQWGATVMSVEQERSANAALNAKKGKEQLGLPDENDPEVQKLIELNGAHRKAGSVSVRRFTDSAALNAQAAAGVVGRSRRSTDGSAGPAASYRLVDSGRSSVGSATTHLQPPSTACAASTTIAPSPCQSTTTTPRLQGMIFPQTPTLGAVTTKEKRDSNGTPPSVRSSAMVEISMVVPPLDTLPGAVPQTRTSATIVTPGIETSTVQVIVMPMDRNSSAVKRASKEKNCSCCCACCPTYFSFCC